MSKHSKQKPEDLDKGLKMYFEFHQLDPKRVAPFPKDFHIPKEMRCVGDAKYVMYRSDKWHDKPDHYIHDHDWNVHYYRPVSDDVDGDIVETPRDILNTSTLVRLGHCMGFGYETPDGLVEADTEAPEPELYCVPNGRCLLIIENKQRVIAMAYGGTLDVTWRGIVG